MASLFQIRRGETLTGALASGELYYDTTSQSLAMGTENGDNVQFAKMGGLNTGSFDLTGNLFVSGNARIVGNLTFGDSDALDTVTVVASLSSSLIPQSSNSFDLGNSTTYWKTAYINSITGSLSGSVNGINVNLFSASVSQSIGTLNNTVTGQENRLNNLEQHSGSVNNFSASITASYNATSLSLNLVSQSLLDVSSSYIATSQSFNIVSSSLLIFSSSQYNADSISFDNRLELVEATSSYLNTTFSSSVDNRLDLLEVSSSNTDGKLNAIHSYTSSLKNALDVTDGNLTVFGDLTVQGNTTTLQTSEVVIEDKSLTLASGSLNSATADGAGLFIAGADVTMSWNHSNNRIEINKNLSITGSISASSITGIGNVAEYSTSVDGRLDIVEATASLYVPFSTSVNGRIDLLETTASYLNTTFSTSVNNRINIVEATASLFVPFSTSVDSRLTLVESTASYLNTTFSTSVDSRIDLLESTASYLNTTFSTSVDSRIDALETFSSSQYKNDSSSFDNRISSSTLTFNDTTNQTGIDFTHNGTQVSAVVSGLGTNSNVQFNNITASNNISASGTVYCQTLVATTLVGATLPVLEYETVGTLGNILIKGAASKSIQVVDSIIFTGLSTGGDQYSATGLLMTGSITASLGFSGSIDGIGNVTIYSQSVLNKIATLATTGSNTFKGNQIISGNLDVTGTLTALEFYTQYVSSSIVYQSGSTKFGDTADDTHNFTGSIYVSGSISSSTVNGIGNVTLYSQSVANRISSLESWSSSLDTGFVTEAELTLLSGAIYQTDATQSNNITIVSASAWGAFQSASSYSGSFYTTINNVWNDAIQASASAWGAFQSASSYSASLATSISSSNAEYTSFSASAASRSAFVSGTFFTTINNVWNDAIQASASAWGAFTSASAYSASLAASITGSSTIVTDLSKSLYQTDTTQSFLISAGFATSSAYSASFYTTINLLSGSLWFTDTTQSANITTVSASAWGAFQSASSYSSSFNTRVSAIEGKYITTGSIGATQTITGKVVVSGSSLIVTGSIEATGDITAFSTSDERLKNNIQLISDPIKKVQQLRGIEFDWKEGTAKAKRHDYGVIAQDVLNVLPELVKQREDGYYGVDYDKIIGLLIEVVKEQEKRIKNLENKLNQ